MEGFWGVKGQKCPPSSAEGWGAGLKCLLVGGRMRRSRGRGGQGPRPVVFSLPPAALPVFAASPGPGLPPAPPESAPKTGTGGTPPGDWREQGWATYPLLDSWGRAGLDCASLGGHTAKRRRGGGQHWVQGPARVGRLQGGRGGGGLGIMGGVQMGMGEVLPWCRGH